MGLIINDPRMVVRTGDTLIADETYKSYPGKFDARLIRRYSGQWDLEAYMKIQFFFEDGSKAHFERMGSKDSPDWADAEKQKYMRAWHRQVRQAWNRHNIGTLNDGCPMSVTFNFYIQEGGWLWDHFEIDVKKTAFSLPGGAQVFPSAFDGDVQLDNTSIEPVSHDTAWNVGEPSMEGYLSSVHEFGHMIGLSYDEYHEDNPHKADKKSAMHSGPEVRARHYYHLLSWANGKVPAEG